MTFEIPQVVDPVANKTIQENTLSTGLGLILTKHHHIRKYGQIHRNVQGWWQLTNLAGDLEWKVAADRFSRAMVGGVALIISTLTRPNDHFRITLGPYAPSTADFLMHERNALQSLLAAGLSRHGLAPTPWHSSRTGPCNTPLGVPGAHFDILPRLQD